jgi:transcriptional antiterminator NusG
MGQVAKWYIVQVYSGSESRMAQLLREAAAKKGLLEKLEDVLVPTEKVVEVKAGERVNVDKQYFPGYVLVKASLDDDMQHLIRSIPRVSGILGMKGRPTPVSESEIKRVLKNVAESVESPRSAVVYDIGDQVKVLDGPFASFVGHVEEIEADKQRLKVSVMIFGRATPISLEYTQIERV